MLSKHNGNSNMHYRVTVQGNNKKKKALQDNKQSYRLIINDLFYLQRLRSAKWDRKMILNTHNILNDVKCQTFDGDISAAV